MARHDYKFRPEARWQDGCFVPPAPLPIQKPTEDWAKLDWIDYIRAASRNPVVAVTEAGLEGRDEPAKGMGAMFFTPVKSATVKEAFVEKADALRMSKLRNAILKPALREGLLTSEGPRWRKDRRALAPVFTPRHVDSFAGIMARSTASSLDGLMRGDVIAFDSAMVELTYKVLSDALFSGELDQGKQTNLSEIDRFLNTMGRPDPLDFLGLPDWVPRPTRIGRMGPVKRLRHHIFELVEDRRRRAAAGQALPDDLLSLLLREDAFDDEQLKDQLITFIAAGHETTSRALTWLFYLLSQDKAARDRVQTEVDALDFDSSPLSWREDLPFTEACLKEAMRLYPPAPFLSRELSRAETLAGNDLPKGTIVFGNIWVIHRNRTTWEQPDAFVPARFMGDTGAQIDRFQYLPFGIGPRICIGARFAMLEAIILIAHIARNYELDLIGDHPWPFVRVTTRPENPLMMRVKART